METTIKAAPVKKVLIISAILGWSRILKRLLKIDRERFVRRAL
jgi:hypothetical protein